MTVLLDEELIKQVRQKQATMIRTSSATVSFSSALNETLRDLLKA
jgi:hypothetical protein